MGLRRFVEPLDGRLLLAIDAATPLSPVDVDSDVLTQSAATAATADGGSLVVYADRDANSGKGKEVWLRRYLANGGPAAVAERVNTYTADAQMNVDVAVASADTYAVVWQSEDQDGSGWGIYARLHLASGWTPEISVAQTTAGNQVNPSIAFTPDGGFAVAWVGRDDNGGNGQIWARKFAPSGSATTDEVAVSTDSNFAVTAPDIAAASSAVGITWVSSDIANAGQTDVAFRQYNATLTAAAAAATTVNTIVTGDQAEPQIASLSGTNDFVIAFSDTAAGSPDATISMRRVNVGGTTYAQQQVSQDSDGNRNRPRVSAASGTVVVGWSQTVAGSFYNATATRMYDANLNAVSNETFTGDGSTLRTLFGLAVTGNGAYREVATQGEFDGSGVGSTGTYVNVLDLRGTSGNDNVVLYDQNASTVRVGINGVASSYSLAGYNHFRIDLGAGNDKLTASDLNISWLSVAGGTGNDTILTGAGDDSINAGDGNDSVDAGAGNDYVSGGNDNDVLLGGVGNDSLAGAAGKDLLYGGDGDDRLTGGNGVDVLYGEGGDDRVYGEVGDDHLDGGAGRDRLYGGDGNDIVLGGSNNDHVYGENGNDTLTGSKGNDILEGGPGNDLAYSYDAGDTLIDIERR